MYAAKKIDGHATEAPVEDFQAHALEAAVRALVEAAAADFGIINVSTEAERLAKLFFVPKVDVSELIFREASAAHVAMEIHDFGDRSHAP